MKDGFSVTRLEACTCAYLVQKSVEIPVFTVVRCKEHATSQFLRCLPSELCELKLERHMTQMYARGMAGEWTENVMISIDTRTERRISGLNVRGEDAKGIVDQ